MTALLPDLEDVRAFLRTRCDDAVPLDGLEVNHVNPRADGSLSMLLEGPGRDGATVRLSARRLPSAKARRFEAELNRRPRGRGGPEAATGFDRAAMYAPELGLLFQVFPADRRLPSLPAAIDPRVVAPILQAELASRADGARIRAVAVEPVRYKPERKCLLRYDVEWAEHTSGAPAVVYARVCRPSRFEQTRDVLPRLTRTALTRFVLPEHLGAREDLQLLLFSEVAGVALFSLVDSPTFPEHCARTGAALHELHGLPVTLPRDAGAAALAERLRHTADEFAALLPGTRDVRGIGRLLEELLRTLPAAPARLVHGDFHGDNVLVDDGDRLALIDLEDCAMGDPAQDAALNLVQLDWHVGRQGAGGTAEAGRRAFLDAYLERADPATAERLPVHVAAQRYLNAFQCLRRPLDPAPAEDARSMLAAAEDALAGVVA